MTKRDAAERKRNQSVVHYENDEICPECQPHLENEQRMHREACETLATALDQTLARLAHAEEGAAFVRESGACPPAVAQLSEANYQAWLAWREADALILERQEA